MNRHFIRIDNRWVHYRRFGEGPAVLVVHGSPQSSRAVEALCKKLAAVGLCAIAPDTPGNGLSTPLPGQPSVADYADALAAFSDALGLNRIALFGYHTGAAIACVFAARYPLRTKGVVLNGLSCWNDSERASMLADYLPPFAPVWDASHMAWAWSRVEEQTVFFPWNAPTPATRMTYDVPTVEASHGNAMDLLDSGDGYRGPYAAAFRFQTDAWLPEVRCPALIAATTMDPLRPHIERPAFDGVATHIFDDQPTLLAAAVDHLTADPGDGAPPAPPSGSDSDGLSRGWIDGIAWTGSLNGENRPLVLLHEAGGSCQVFEPLLPAVARHRPVLALDLPGHGLSSAAFDGDATHTATYATMVEALSETLDLGCPAIAGIGFGASIAATLAAQGAAAAAGQLGWPSGPPEGTVAEAAPSLAPTWDGAHLVRAFRIARWERLFDPWFRRDRAHAKPQASLDSNDVQRRAVDLLRAGDTWAAATTAERQSRVGGALGLSTVEDPLAWTKPLIYFARTFTRQVVPQVASKVAPQIASGGMAIRRPIRYDTSISTKKGISA